eukprot:5760403-Pleurochrysis_carterae.AAC.1
MIGISAQKPRNLRSASLPVMQAASRQLAEARRKAHRYEPVELLCADLSSHEKSAVFTPPQSNGCALAHLVFLLDSSAVLAARSHAGCRACLSCGSTAVLVSACGRSPFPWPMRHLPFPTSSV